MHKFLPLLLFLLSASSSTLAQHSGSRPFSIGETVELKSAVLNETRTLNIYLPEGYHPDSTTVYSVIYLLDGTYNEDFVHIVGLVQFFNMMMGMPPTLVVGIANVDRKRDFTYPTTDPEYLKIIPTSGGSEKFIRFLEEELQPYIKTRYRVDERRILIGQSLGGLLASEILLKKAYLFSDYLIVSPSLWWDDESMYRQADQLLSKQNIKHAQVYISVGTEGKIMERDAKGLYKLLTKHNHGNLDLHFMPLKEENHATILHEAIYRAFRILYPYKK